MLQRTLITRSTSTSRGPGRRRGRAVIAGVAVASFALGAAACNDDDVDDVNDELDDGVDELEDGVDDIVDEIDEEVSD